MIDMTFESRRWAKSTLLLAMLVPSACGGGKGGGGSSSTTNGADDEECHTGCDTTGSDVEGPGIPMSVAIQYADGAGGFGEPQLVAIDLGDDAIEFYSVELLVADLNGDAHVDLLVYHSRELLALAGTADGELTALDSISVDNLRQVVPAHDADGMVGVLVYNWHESHDLSFHPWSGEGFEPVQFLEAPPRGAIGVGDLDGDGLVDAIAAGRDELLHDGLDVYTYLNLGEGTDASEIYTNLVDSNGAEAIEIADLDDDGFLDVVMAVDDHEYGMLESPTTGAVVLLPGDGTGALLTPVRTELGQAPRELLVGDFDGSNGLDALIRNGTDELHLALNGGTGLTSFARANGDADVLFGVGRVDDDGRSDALVGSYWFHVLLGHPDGIFDWVELEGAYRYPYDRATLADFDGDGFDDVLYVVRPNP